MRRTLEQERARDALEKVKVLVHRTVENEDQAGVNDRYAKAAKALPAAIIMNGLGQALATVRAGNQKEEYQLLYDHFNEWLCRNEPTAPYPGDGDVLSAITRGSREDYLVAQTEALAWLNWLKKFSTAYLEKAQERRR